MSFVLICIASIILLGILAALSSLGGKDEPVVEGKNCSTCSSMTDGSCKIACLMESTQAGMEKKKQKNNKKTDCSV